MSELQMVREPMENRNGTLYFDGVSVSELAQRFDTPLYVISESRIRENYRRLYNVLTITIEKSGFSMR